MAGTTQDQIMGLDVMLDVLAKIRNNPSNPYVNYNNQDRIANVALRYYMTWLESNTKNKLKPQANFLLDKFSTYQQG